MIPQVVTLGARPDLQKRIWTRLLHPASCVVKELVCEFPLAY